jgi:hypothetical protein
LSKGFRDAIGALCLLLHGLFSPRSYTPHTSKTPTNLQRLGPARELRRDLDLGRRAARDQKALVHEAAHAAQRVVQGAVGLVQDEAVGAAQQDGRGAALGGDAGDLDDAALAALFG